MTDARLLIPLADLPGLDPVGLRVTVHTPGRRSRVALMGEEYSDNVCRLHERGGSETLWLDLDESECSTLHLDLSDPATRDRCLRWLAGRVGLKVGCGAPAWWCAADLDPTDDTRLPDGSRLVDALDLAAVLRQIGGAK